MKGIHLINIGFGNTVAVRRIIAVVSPESSPIKRLIQDARDNNMLVDATYGRRTRAVIVCDNGSIVLSSIQPETIASRASGKEPDSDDDTDKLEDVAPDDDSLD